MSLLEDWSKDGKNIAFSSNRDGNWQNYRIHADGSMPVNISQSKSNDFAPSWSDDDSHLVFHSDRASGRASQRGSRKIFLMNSDGSGVSQLTRDDNSNDYFPRWSSDGDRVVYDSRISGGKMEIFSINKNGFHRTQLTGLSER